METNKNLSIYVADVLRANAAHRKVRQTALAAASGLSQPTVSRILSSDRDIRLDELAMICDGLELSMDDVLAEARRLLKAKAGSMPHIIS